MKTAVDSYGTVNILVNNAGFGGGGRENPFATDADYLVRVYSVNVFAPWKLCRLVVPYMKESGYGSIVNITSMSSVDKEAAMSIYSSSKAALNHMAANLAYDFGPMGVRVNCVGPGATRTAASRRFSRPRWRSACFAIRLCSVLARSTMWPARCCSLPRLQRRG